jgi:hypothetical protein
MLLIARASLLIRRFGAAIAAITLVAATSSSPTDSPRSLFTRGDFSAAAAAYETVLRSNPSDSTAQLGLGTIRLYENDLRRAEPLLRAALATDPENPRTARLLTEIARRRAESSRPASVAGSETMVPFVTADPLPVVRGVANGRAANFLVDTGADVELEPAFADQIGVKAEGSSTGVFAGGLHAPVQSGTLESLALGAASARSVPVHVMATHAADIIPNLKIDGIVGTTYFERFLVTIDYPRRALRLRPRSQQISANFQAAARAAGSAIVPCYLVGDHFVVAQAQVNEAAPGLFLFDSGLAGGGLMPSAALLASAGIAPDQAHAQTGYGGGGAVTAVPFVANRIAVGSAIVQNVPGIFTPQGTPFGIFPFTVWGVVSNDFLKHYAYTVDFDAMTIVLQPPASGG